VSAPPTVLAVLGEAALLDFVADLLEAGGYRVRAAADARAAVRAVARERPALLLVDAAPAAEGWRLLAAYATEWALPLLLLGAPEAEPPSDGAAALPWPLDPAALLGAVAALAGRGTG
jgi:DNA-binding response OmpR family regulator